VEDAMSRHSFEQREEERAELCRVQLVEDHLCRFEIGICLEESGLLRSLVFAEEVEGFVA